MRPHRPYRPYLAGLLAGAAVGAAAVGLTGLTLLRAFGSDPSGQQRRVLEHLEYRRRLAEQRAEHAERLLADQLRRGGFATLPAPAPPPGDSPEDRIPPQNLPLPTRPTGE